jgi:3-dehydroquinate dehydratase
MTHAPAHHNTRLYVWIWGALVALLVLGMLVFELHLSNIHRREEIYQNSLVSRVATAVFMGLGADGYPTAVAAMLRRLAKPA